MASPIVRATWQAAMMSALSNILAQLMTCWRTEASWHIDTTTLFQFVLFSVLACPPNYIWQSWLEAKFPARGAELTPQEKEAQLDRSILGDGANGHGNAQNIDTSSKKMDAAKAVSGNKSAPLNKKNTAIKFSLDQTLGAGANTVLFIAGIGLIRGQPWTMIKHDIQTQFWPMISAGQKLWPLVSVLNFTVVPLQYRMLVGSTAGLFWGIYLSLVSTSHK